jgi:pyruvate kinase
MAIDIHAKAIVVCSISGITVRLVSRFRSPVDIIGMTTDEKTWRKLSLSWGVTPVMNETVNSTDVLFYMAKKAAKQTFNLKKGDEIVITGGMVNGVKGNTNLIKLEVI